MSWTIYHSLKLWGSAVSLTFSERSSVFIDLKMTTALYRLAHHCHIIETRNEPFRYKQSTASAKVKIQQREKDKIYLVADNQQEVKD